MKHLRNLESESAFNAEKSALTPPWVCYFPISTTVARVVYSNGSQYDIGIGETPVAGTSALCGVAIAGAAVCGSI